MPTDILLIVSAITAGFVLFAIAVSWADHQSKLARDAAGS